MELTLSTPVLAGVYSYLSYRDLCKHKNVPDNIWKIMYEWFIRDVDFKSEINKLWGNIEKYISYKKRILCFIKFLIKSNLYLPEILKQHRDFILDRINEGYYCKETIHDFITNPELMLAVIKNDASQLKNIHPSLQEDLNFLIQAVRCNKYALLYAHQKWRYEIVGEVASQCGVILQDDLVEVYRQCVIAMISMNPEYFDDLELDMKKDSNIIQVSHKKSMERKKIFKDQNKYIHSYFSSLTEETALIAIEHGMELSLLEQELSNNKTFI